MQGLVEGGAGWAGAVYDNRLNYCTVGVRKGLSPQGRHLLTSRQLAYYTYYVLANLNFKRYRKIKLI